MSKPNPARAAVLDSIRRSLNRQGELHPAIAEHLQERINKPSTGIQPAFSEDLVTRFQRKVEKSGATTSLIRGKTAVVEAVKEYLKVHGLDGPLVLSNEPAVLSHDWSEFTLADTDSLETDHGIAVTSAELAIAEAGTVMLLSGSDRHSHLYLLAETHIVILHAAHFVKHIEDAWQHLRKRGAALPRVVNLISGPSKTADVEQTIQIGAHGPKRLHFVIQPN